MTPDSHKKTCTFWFNFCCSKTMSSKLGESRLCSIQYSILTYRTPPYITGLEAQKQGLAYIKFLHNNAKNIFWQMVIF